MDTSNRVCKVCGQLVVGYTKHIVDNHVDLITEDTTQVKETFGVSNRTSQIIRRRVGKIKERLCICPRCKIIVKSKQAHLVQCHAAELVIAKSNGFTYTDIVKMLFNGWCSIATLSLVAKEIRIKGNTIHIPKPIVIICEDKDGSVRLMEKGEYGIGIAMSL